MISGPIDAIPLWLLFLGASLIAGLALEGGYRLGRWRHANAAGEKEGPVGAMVGSMLGLLAFFLAFTFSTAASRFEIRRTTVLDEANAVGTTYLRTRFLPEPQRSDTARLLREYVDVRIRGVREGKLAETIARSEELHELLWENAVHAAENKSANSVMLGLFVQSLNEMIDLHANRVAAGIRNRIPISIWTGLGLLALLGMAAIGYQSGLAGTRHSPAMLATVLAFAGVFYLIADLDRPGEGFLTVSQQALIDVQKNMKVAPTP